MLGRACEAVRRAARPGALVPLLERSRLARGLGVVVLGVLGSLPAAFSLGLLRLWWWADRAGIPAPVGAAAGGGAMCCLALMAWTSVLVGEVVRERRWRGLWVRLLFDGAYVLGVVVWWAVFLS